MLLLLARPAAASISFQPSVWNAYNAYTASGVKSSQLFPGDDMSSPHLFPLDLAWNVKVGDARTPQHASRGFRPHGVVSVHMLACRTAAGRGPLWSTPPCRWPLAGPRTWVGIGNLLGALAAVFFATATDAT